MSENENDRNDAAEGRVPSPGPPVPSPPRHRAAPHAAKAPRENPGPAEGDEGSKTIPGEDPEDNPDLKGEERFDAG